MVQLLQVSIPLDQIQKRKVVYGLDDKQLVADTKLDKERKANEGKIKWIQSLLSTAPNEQLPNQEPWQKIEFLGNNPAKCEEQRDELQVHYDNYRVLCDSIINKEEVLCDLTKVSKSTLELILPLFDYCQIWYCCQIH